MLLKCLYLFGSSSTCREAHSIQFSIIAAISMGGLLAGVAQMTQQALCIKEITEANLLHMVHEAMLSFSSGRCIMGRDLMISLQCISCKYTLSVWMTGCGPVQKAFQPWSVL